MEGKRRFNRRDHKDKDLRGRKSDRPRTESQQAEKLRTKMENIFRGDGVFPAKSAFSRVRDM